MLKVWNGYTEEPRSNHCTNRILNIIYNIYIYLWLISLFLSSIFFILDTFGNHRWPTDYTIRDEIINHSRDDLVLLVKTYLQTSDNYFQVIISAHYQILLRTQYQNKTKDKKWSAIQDDLSSQTSSRWALELELFMALDTPILV